MGYCQHFLKIFNNLYFQLISIINNLIFHFSLPRKLSTYYMLNYKKDVYSTHFFNVTFYSIFPTLLVALKVCSLFLFVRTYLELIL